MKRCLLLPLTSIMLVACGTDVSGPTTSLLSCVFEGPSGLEPGEVLQVRGAANTTCIAPDAGAVGEFIYIPFFGANPPEDDERDVSLALGLRVLDGGVPLAGPRQSLRNEWPVPKVTADHEFHHQLRRREIDELTPLIRLSPEHHRSPAAAFGTAGEVGMVPQVGDLRSYNVAISCSGEDLRTGRVMYVSEHALVVADTANPAGLNSQDYAYFGVTFDTLVYPVETAHFGVPGDIDENGRTILFFTRAVNELNPRSGNSVTIGFFWSGDLFPEQGSGRLEGCPAANQAEMLYLVAPDPAGVAGRPFPLDELRNRAIPLIGHEFQHLVNASRRLFVNDADGFEDPWLNEGLSHIAEELLFYAAADLEPSRNLTADDLRAKPNGVAAFNEFVSGNLTNLRHYLTTPGTASLFDGDELATRGAAWAFLRYAADRADRGDAPFFFDLVNSRASGVDNLDDVIGPGAPMDWMRDWTVSIYADDFVPGVDERFTMASWNLRSIFDATAIASYPLEIRTLEPENTVQAGLLPGGAIFTRFHVAAGRQAVVEVKGEERSLPDDLRGSFLRIQ